jgi:hypothetical protein
MQDTRQYNAAFFRAEIERDTLALNQGISNEQRVQLQNRIAAARQHLADAEARDQNGTGQSH